MKYDKNVFCFGQDKVLHVIEWGWRKKELEMVRAHRGRSMEVCWNKCYKSSKEGETMEDQNNQENRLRIIAFWRLDEDLYFVCKRQLDLRQAERYGKAFWTREMEWITAQRPGYTGILPFLVKTCPSLTSVHVSALFFWSISHNELCEKNPYQEFA